MKLLVRITTLVLVLAAASSATAQLRIIRNFAGGAQPGNAVGGGNLVTIFNAAADLWEAAIQDSHTVTISYSWAALGGSTLGVHNLLTEGGSPHREISGRIRFDNDGSSVFFLDPSPTDNSEYTTFTVTNGNLPGFINTGRQWTGATGNASGRVDLFSVALHEIGHALGLSSANNAFVAEATDSDVDLTSPRIPSGSAIPITSPSNAHVAISTALMWPSSSRSRRTLISDADLMANCQISRFASFSRNPQFGTPVVQDDVILSAIGSNSGLYKYDWTNSTSTVTTLVSGPNLSCVMTNWGNGTYLTVDTSNNRLLRATSSGVLTTISTLPSGAGQAMALNQNGYVAIANFTATTGGIYNVFYTGTSGSTLRSGLPLNGLCRSTNDGQFYGVSFSPSRLYRITTTGSVQTLATYSGSGLTGICYMPDQNRFALADGSGNRVLFVTTTGSVVHSTSTPAFCNAITYHEKYRQLFAVTNAGHIIRMSTGGSTLVTKQISGVLFSGVDIADDRNVTVFTNGVAGTNVAVFGSFDQSRGRPYCVAVALGQRPGLAFGNRYQHVAADGLFFLTVCGALPGVTSGFAGTTSSSDGSFNASFQLLAGLPNNVMIYVVASAVNPAFPLGLDFGTVEAVDVN